MKANQLIEKTGDWTIAARGHSDEQKDQRFAELLDMFAISANFTP
jgi:hypothetical protein